MVFRDFAELPDHVGTAALARGWLHQAERLAARGELDAELDAYVAAHRSKVAELQQRALIGLARVFMRTRQWPQLGATLAQLGPGPLEQSLLDWQQRAELRRMQVTVLVSRRDLLGAARVLDSSDVLAADDVVLRAAMLELARVRLTEHDLDGSLLLAELPGLDLDGDRVGELLIAKPGASRLTVLGSASANLRELGHIELEPRRALGPITDVRTLVRDQQAFVAVRRGTTQSLHRLSRVGEQLGAERIAKYEQSGEQAASWAIADLDRDQVLELYLGLQAPRRLLGLELDSKRWIDPHPSSNAASSVIYGLEAVDLDGDGEQELAALVGEWSAYDLRLLGPDKRTDRSTDALQIPSLRMLGRRKLGAVQSIASLPAGEGRHWLAVGVGDSYPSLRMFPAAAPSGSPGLHLLGWDGEAIELLESWPLPNPARVLAGDFDGNGLHDLAVGLRSHDQYECVLMLQTRAGEFRPLAMRELWPVGVINLDHDDDDELLVLDVGPTRDDGRLHGQLQVLGSGIDRLPVLPDATRPAPAAALTQPRASEDPALDNAIAHAEDLASIGLSQRAASSLGALARVADEQLAAHLRVRAAELFASVGHRLEAAHLYARALAKPGALGDLREAVLSRAIDLYAQVHRFGQAAELAANALGWDAQPSGLAAEHQRLRSLADELPQLQFDFDAPLDERWWIDPLAVRRQHGRLELELGGAEQGVVARRQFDWHGDRLTLTVELEVEALEWSGGIGIELRPLTEPTHEPLDVGVWSSASGRRAAAGSINWRCAAPTVARTSPAVTAYRSRWLAPSCRSRVAASSCRPSMSAVATCGASSMVKVCTSRRRSAAGLRRAATSW